MIKAFGLLLALSLPAGADVCGLVARLNATIRDETGYAALPCPPIGRTALPPGQTGMRSQAGAYDPATGRIELAPDLDLTTALGQSYLLHELVHAAQFANGADRRAACKGVLEAEAYAVQARFLQAQGHDTEALPIFLLGTQLGGCGQSDY
jgi:hypothetical protein